VKVPGTTNAKHAISDPVIPLPRDENYADISITGLPLTIDMQVRMYQTRSPLIDCPLQTLRTLFAPQVIKTSKFFHTAGTPRRLVGFIRWVIPSMHEHIINMRIDSKDNKLQKILSNACMDPMYLVGLKISPCNLWVQGTIR
jgi:hypothetical protein